MPRRNRVDPWGDLHAVSARGLFTGNRGCIVDEREQVVRHHRSSTLWITCLTEFRDWRVPLARPNRWTPIFFLDDAVALAAGHRPCATCRREMYRSYRDAVDPALRAVELDRRLTTERLRRGSGIDRGRDRKTWRADLESLPDGTVIIGADDQARLVLADRMLAFSFSGWTRPEARAGILHSCFIDGQRGRPIFSVDPFVFATLRGCGVLDMLNATRRLRATGST
jgi:hypothetical protein